MSDDELISAYADGTLQGAERAAFEARLAREADLQRKVAATQLLLREAPALRVSMVPRNFILPASAAARSPRPRAAQPWALRLAAALALFLFVSLLVLESALQPLSQTPAGMPAMPMAAEPMQEAAPQSEGVGQRMLPQALPADITAIPTPTEPTPRRWLPRARSSLPRLSCSSPHYACWLGLRSF